MKDTLQVGLTTTARITVDTDRTISFMGDEGRVYATPAVVRDVEMTCRNLLLQRVDPGEDSVGTRVEIDHLAATPLGLWVDITATVVDVAGRRVTLEFSVRDPVEEVARGRHGRFVVATAKTVERLRDKVAKAKQAMGG
ncbi:MAG: thioesterase family protein [Gemmatimonadales bacterium]